MAVGIGMTARLVWPRLQPRTGRKVFRNCGGKGKAFGGKDGREISAPAGAATSDASTLGWPRSGPRVGHRLPRGGLRYDGTACSSGLMAMQPDSSRPGTVRRPRRSASAAKSRELELARVRALSVQERIALALTMRERFSWLRPETVGKRR